MPAFADITRSPLARFTAALGLAASLFLSACGGGGGGGDDPGGGGEVVDPPPTGSTWGVVNTLDPNTIFQFSNTAGLGSSGDGGTPGGVDGDGVAVGGGLGKTRQVRIAVARVADGTSLGQALTGSNTGLARVKAIAGAAPIAITLQGTPTGTYYDAGVNEMLSIGADQQLHALVLDFDRHLGVTTLTEGAYLYALNNFLQDRDAVRAGSVPLKRTATAEELARLTSTQIQQANEAVRSEINRVLPARYALDSISTLPTPVDKLSPANAIVDNSYGRMYAVVGGLALAAARFKPALPAPGLTINAQLAADLSDGVIDGKALDQSSVFGATDAAYDPATLASLLAQAADVQFTRFGNSDGAPAAPVITQPPFSTAITAGNTALLTVVATGSRLEYQWFARLGSSTNFTALTGETQTVLKTSVGGEYFVRVSNAVGTVDSTPVSVVVTSTPPSSPPVITAQPASVSLPANTSTTFTVVASGTNLRYQWFTDDGASLGPGYTASSFSTSTPGGYYVVVTNDVGFVRSGIATLSVVLVPTIAAQPRSVTINVGQTTTLSVVATGTGPLSYQWRNAGGDIGGATSASYTTGVAGTYSVVVSNAAGSTPSSTATVTVIGLPTITTQPSSVTINQGQTATLSVVATGLNLAYEWQLNGSPIGGANSASYTTGTPGTYTVVVSNAAGRVTSNPATVTASAAPTITTQPQSVAINPGQTATLTVVATGTAPLTYQWRNASGDIAGATNPTYTTSTAGSYTVVVRNAAGSVTSSAATVTINSAPAITTQPQSVTINQGQTTTLSVVATGAGTLTYQWRNAGVNIPGATSATYTTGAAGTYSVVVTNAAGSTPSSNATVTVVVPPAITTQPQSVTIGSTQTTTLTVVATGTAPLTYQWRNGSADIAGATSSSYTTGVAGAYSVVVANAANSVTSNTATVTVVSPPAITTQPRSVTINSGQTTTLTVAATGAGTLTYQWRNANGNISGATSSSYTTGVAGAYSVVVTNNPGGSTTSSTATVTVIVPPSITTHPQSVTINNNQSATLSVGVSGTAPFSYQWQRNSANIGGATNATYTTSTAATYRVLVTNPAGTATSNGATVTVR